MIDQITIKIYQLKHKETNHGKLLSSASKASRAVICTDITSALCKAVNCVVSIAGGGDREAADRGLGC